MPLYPILGFVPPDLPAREVNLSGVVKKKRTPEDIRAYNRQWHHDHAEERRKAMRDRYWAKKEQSNER